MISVSSLSCINVQPANKKESIKGIVKLQTVFGGEMLYSLQWAFMVNIPQIALFIKVIFFLANVRDNPPAVQLATKFERCNALNLRQENARARRSGNLPCYVHFA